MTRFEKIGELVEQARELDRSARTTLLGDAAAGDPDRRAEVERLLALHEADGLLERPEQAIDAELVARAVRQGAGAGRSAEEALEGLEQAYGSRSLPVADADSLLGMIQHDRASFAFADESYRAAEERFLELFGPRHVARAQLLRQWDALHESTGDCSEAERCLTEALSIDRGVLGEHPQVAASLFSLGAVLEDQDRPEEALESMIESVELGRCLLALGRVEEAEVCLEEARDVFTAFFGPDHSSVCEMLSELDQLRSP
jgi:tetratricopeptide (TPR) repeat protein